MWYCVLRAAEAGTETINGGFRFNFDSICNKIVSDMGLLFIVLNIGLNKHYFISWTATDIRSKKTLGLSLTGKRIQHWKTNASFPHYHKHNLRLNIKEHNLKTVLNVYIFSKLDYLLTLYCTNQSSVSLNLYERQKMECEHAHKLCLSDFKR